MQRKIFSRKIGGRSWPVMGGWAGDLEPADLVGSNPLRSISSLSDSAGRPSVPLPLPCPQHAHQPLHPPQKKEDAPDALELPVVLPLPHPHAAPLLQLQQRLPPRLAPAPFPRLWISVPAGLPWGHDPLLLLPLLCNVLLPTTNKVLHDERLNAAACVASPHAARQRGATKKGTAFALLQGLQLPHPPTYTFPRFAPNASATAEPPSATLQITISATAEPPSAPLQITISATENLPLCRYKNLGPGWSFSHPLPCTFYFLSYRVFSKENILFFLINCLFYCLLWT